MLRGLTIDLRQVRESDLGELHELYADIEARGDYYPRDLRSWPAYRRRYEETGFWHDDHGAMVITSKNGLILGQISYFKNSGYRDSLEIAYIVLRPQVRGQGVMSEALTLFSAYLFETRKVNRLELSIVPGNDASQRVAEKAGFRREGLLRGAIFLRGRNQDLALYALLRDEWRARDSGG